MSSPGSWDGGGNRETGARWNSPGAGVVYTSRSFALCVLETIVRLPSRACSAAPR
ncbi:MAG: RES domain-containing protein [Geminicoccaceae bacterium]